MESLELFENVRATGGRAVMATLVRTKGTTPRRAGARMFVGEGGHILGSVTIGGCVDARVIEEAEAIMAGRSPKLLEMELGDEEAWELGLTCGGTVEVLIDPLDFPNPEDRAVELHELAYRETQAGRQVALATLVNMPAGSEVPIGTRVLIDDDGRARGTLLEALRHQIVQDARDLMARGMSQMRSYHIDGQGRFEVFIEVFGPSLPLLIFGGSHVAIALVSFAKRLGFRTVVVDGRPRFANRERFPEAEEVIEGIPSEVAERLAMGPTTAVVLLAHDYKYEVPVLKRALATDVFYIGLLGSRKRGHAILDLLREQGIEERQLRRIHVPIGLDVGAQTAPEIALCILAQILASRSGRSGGTLSETHRMAATPQAH
jgi:xanthine dehydrogenase accessory factor